MFNFRLFLSRLYYFNGSATFQERPHQLAQRNHQKEDQCNLNLRQVRLKSLEELSNGVHFCFLLNIMTDGKFGVAKINQEAKLEHEKLQNLKLLIVGMGNNNIDQNFDVHISLLRLRRSPARTTRKSCTCFSGSTR